MEDEYFCKSIPQDDPHSTANFLNALIGLASVSIYPFLLGVLFGWLIFR